MTCLQRLVISNGLPKTRLKDAVDAFNACTELGLDLQLKVLQALPSLLQNYAEDLVGELLASTLQACTSLQSAKAPTVSGVAAATLQQLVTAVFEKVVEEDRRASSVPTITEVPGDGQPIPLRPAAFDAYKVFRDLVLVAEEQPTNFVQLKGLSADASLELISSCLHGNPRLFISHAELNAVVRSNLIPVATRSLTEKLPFPITVRYFRILDFILCRYLSRFTEEAEVIIGLLTQNLDQDAGLSWKRVMAMEVVRNFFASGSAVVEAYALFDYTEDGKFVVQDLMSAFVRLSAEKPAVIGLGQQSSVPIGINSRRETGSDHASMEVAGGVAGVISSALGVSELGVSGISSDWSIPRASCLDQLDKIDAPSLPDTYIYTLVLDCLNSLSETFAKAVLPLTVQHDGRRDHVDSTSQSNGHTATRRPNSRTHRSQSFRKRTVPLNPLNQEGNPQVERARVVAQFLDNCWPAVLATSSTFLNSALEDLYYRNLIKAYQRFAQVAGLLRLNTARDALMTTLSKSAVPPHVLNAALSESGKSPVAENPRSFSGTKGLLSVDSLIGQSSSLSGDRERRSSIESVKAVLTTRNLLCLRALLNLAIALGPTLGTAFKVVVDTLRQADMVLSTGPSQQATRQMNILSPKGVDSAAFVQAFSAEVAAVEAAASRLLESTADFPNDAFVSILQAFSQLLSIGPSAASGSPKEHQTSPPPTPRAKERTFSGLPGISTFAEMHERDYKFVIPKLGHLAQLNVARFTANDPNDSGWNILVDEMTNIACVASKPREARQATTDVLCKVAAEAILDVVQEDKGIRANVQQQSLAVLLRLVEGIYSEDGDLTNTDLDVQVQVLEALKAILERCGDSIVAGWGNMIAILSSAFERTEFVAFRLQDDHATKIQWDHITSDFVSVAVGRIAFDATQLLCSDFLSALPTATLPSLIELLHHFVCQTDDLNVALTTVTMIWNAADHLFGKVSQQALCDTISRLHDADDIEEEIQRLSQDETSAQLLLTLMRMRDIVGETQKEVRNATFQTICSIFKNHGDQLTPETWDLLLRNVVLRVASHDAMVHIEKAESTNRQDARWERLSEDISASIIGGVSEIFAQHLHTIERSKRFPSLWEILLSALEAYLDSESHIMNAAVYRALAKVLSEVVPGSSLWTTPAYRTVALWLKRVPEQAENIDNKHSNEDAFLAYVTTGSQLYRLTRQSMGSPQTRKFVDNIYYCIKSSDGPKWSGDLANTSLLQTEAVLLLKSIRTDLPNMPSRLIGAAAQISVLHHDRQEAGHEGPTFVAVASVAIDWLKSLILEFLGENELIETGALVSSLQSLRRIITEKYAFSSERNGVTLWRKATSVAQELAEPILKLADMPKTERSAAVSLWAEYAAITAGVVKANNLRPTIDEGKVHKDQIADIESFELLQRILIPRLGDLKLPDEIRQAYCVSIFEASIVHNVETVEVRQPGVSPIAHLGDIRPGRIKPAPFSSREKMSYACFSELIALASQQDNSLQHEKLAQTAAPLLILRLAMPVRAYIADQPLRGRKPQPLSELEELMFCFEEIGKLQLHPKALAADPATCAHSGKKAHLHYLYPLLAKAVGIAGNPWCGAAEVFNPLQTLLEQINVMS